MPDCPQLQRMLEQTTEGSAAEQQEALRRHVERCEVCQAQLERLRWIGPTVREVGRRSSNGEGHPSDLQLADFAESGYAAGDAGEIIMHLSRCHDCREAVVSAWSAVVQHHSESAANADAGGVQRWRPGRVAYGLGALAAYAGECVLLAIVVTQFVLAWIIEPLGFQSVPAIWPLVAVPGGAIRFWLLVTICLLGAAALRWAAGHLLLRAAEHARQKGASR